jgi:hypothetical protein
MLTAATIPLTHTFPKDLDLAVRGGFEEPTLGTKNSCGLAPFVTLKFHDIYKFLVTREWTIWVYASAVWDTEGSVEQ